MQQNVPSHSPESTVQSVGGTGPTSPLQVVPQAMDNANIRNVLSQNIITQQASGNNRIQELPIQEQKPIIFGGNNVSTFSTAAISNQTTKKIILQPLTQPSNIILTSGGQPILLQATSQGNLH